MLLSVTIPDNHVPQVVLLQYSHEFVDRHHLLASSTELAVLVTDFLLLEEVFVAANDPLHKSYLSLKTPL